MELAGKVAFVTASANGIGKGYAEALLQKGVKVFISDIDEKTGAATLAEFEGKFGPENVKFAKLDVSNEARFEEVFQEAINAFGPIDIMVNNAGVMNEETWKLMINVNLFGVVKGTKLAEEHMRKDKGGKGGRIINISSVAGLLDSCALPVYCATKHGVRSFTMSQAGQFDLQARGLQYAIVCPDRVDTDLVNKADDSKINYYGVMKPYFDDTMPVSKVVEAFMMLLQLEDMNGGIVKVMKDSIAFQKLELIDMGASFKSSLK